MGQTALHDRPARWVHRDRMRSLAKPDGLSNRIDIAAGQQPDFATGGAMQQGEDADQGLMRSGVPCRAGTADDWSARRRAVAPAR